MNNLLKKSGALFLALAIIFTMSFSVFAATPKATDTATISVTNVEEGATVVAYQIVKANYNDAGIESYEAVIKDSIKDLEHPTAAEVSALVGQLGSLTTSYTMTYADGKYSATAPAGLYMVLAQETNTKIYNPMLVAVNYDPDSVPINGTVDANTNFTNDAYAKSTAPAVDKKITSTDTNSKANENGGDVKIGDTVSFEIDTKIPSYNYANPVFKVSDTLSAGFDAPTDIVVKVAGETAAAGTDYTLTTTGNDFVVNFNSDYILANGLKDVVITYKAVVNENAGSNFDPSTNKAEIEYSNDPSDSSKTGKKDDITYTYTFGIDANLGGSNTTEYKTHEIIKTDEDGEITVDKDSNPDKITVKNPLAGAEFTLTSKADSNVKYVKTTDANGYLSYTGLDAGEYTLVETNAPKGYAADVTEHAVVISADYNTDGTLKSYTITIDGNTTSTYTATYDGGTTTVEATQQGTFQIKNSPIPTLPSTGGMGTYLFTILGVLIMAAAIVMYTRRRKTEER